MSPCVVLEDNKCARQEYCLVETKDLLVLVDKQHSTHLEEELSLNLANTFIIYGVT